MVRMTLGSDREQTSGRKFLTSTAMKRSPGIARRSVPLLAPFLLLLFAIIPSLSVFAQTSSALPSACLFSGGEASVTHPFPLHYSPRTFAGIHYRYRAGEGWEVPLPKIVRESSGRILYSDSSCWHELHYDSAQNLYISRTGLRFEMVHPTHFREWLSNGQKSDFNHILSGGAAGQSTVLMPSRVENRFGWRSELHYNPTFPALVSSILIDIAPQSSTPTYRWQFFHSPQGRLDRLELRSGSATASLASYIFGYAPSNGALQSIARRGSSGGTLGTTQYFYRTANPGLGLLEREVTSLGGETILDYQSVAVQSPTGGNFQQPVVSRITLRSGTPGDADQAVDINYQNPVTANGFFLGFGEIQHTDSDGKNTVTQIANSSLAVVGEVRQVESRSAAGAVLARSNLVYAIGGVNNARRTLRHVVNTNFANTPGNATTRGVEYEWDFTNDRLHRVTYHNQAVYDSTTQSFTSQHREDNVVRTYSYAPDIPALGLRERLQAVVELSGANNTKTLEKLYSYATDHQPRLIEEWESETKSYRTTELQLNSLGNLTKISRAGGEAQFTWSGPRITRTTVNPGTTNLETRYVYAPSTGLLQSIREPSGIQTTFSYDQFFRFSSQSRVSADNSHSLLLASISYNSNQKTVAITEVGTQSTYAVDGFGTARKASETPSQAGVVGASAAGLNALGQVDRVALPEFFSTTTGYSPQELQSVHGFTLGYDERGDLSSITPDSLADGASALTSLPHAPGVPGSPSVNPQGRTINSSPGAAPSWVSTFSNLTVGSRGSGAEAVQASSLDLPFAKYVTDGLGNVAYERKNSLGQTVESKGSDGTLLRYTYDKHGRLFRVTRPSGAFVEYQYEAAGRLHSATYRGPTGAAFTNRYLWDAPSAQGMVVPRGQLAAMVGPHDRLDFSYDALGRIDTVKQTHFDGAAAVSRTFAFEFENRFGQIRQIAYPSEFIGGAATIQYFYDSQGREKEVFASPIAHLVPSELLRSVVSRNAAGLIEQVDTFNDTREIQHISPTTGGLLRYEMRRTSTNQLLGERQHTFGQGRLLEQSITLNGHTLREQYTQVDSRPNLRQIIRQRDNLPPETINLDYDGAGRPLVDAKRNLSVYYNQNSGHPALIDGVQSGQATYPWSYDVDSQLTTLTGPQPEDQAGFAYAPDGSVSRVTKPNGEWVDITRGVLGDIIRIKYFRQNGTLKRDYRKFLFGLYAEDTDEFDTTLGVVNVFGETLAGEEGIIARFYFAAGSSSGFLDGPSFGGSPDPQDPTPTPNPTPTPAQTDPKRPVDPKPPICGDKVVNGTEQCDPDPNVCLFPLISSCVKCKCVLDSPPPVKIELPHRYLTHDQTGTFIDPTDIWDILYAALTESRSRYKELYRELGVPIESDGPCDELVLSKYERTRPDIITADLIVLQLVAGELAHELGISEVMNECSEERRVPEYVEEVEQPSVWGEVIHFSLDVAGTFDPIGVCDGLNCIIYVIEGRGADAAVSAIAIIPYIGDAAKAGRLGTTACRTANGATKLVGRTTYRITGYVLKTMKRTIPTGVFRISDPSKIKMILGTYPRYKEVGRLGRYLHFDMGDQWGKVAKRYGDDMTSALNREALDIVAPLAQRGVVQIDLVLKPGENLTDILTNALGRGAGLRSEVLHLSEQYGLNLVNEGGKWCFRTGSRAVDPSGVPAYLKNLFPGINWAKHASDFKRFSSIPVPGNLRDRLMSGEWLKNIEKIRGLLQ